MDSKIVEKSSESARKPKRLHYAWIIAFAGMLISGAGVGIINSTTGIFIKPVCDALGFSRGEFTIYSSIATLVCVALMPAFGSLFRKYGFRKISIIGAIVCGLSLLCFSFATELWHFYTLAFISGLFVNGISIMAVGILVNKWFIDKRGIATGIAYSGTGLLAAVLIPITTRFIELNGLEWSYRFLGGVSLFILLPIILFVIKNNPEDMGLEPYRDKKNEVTKKIIQESATSETGITREKAIRSVPFWLLAIAVMGIALCQAGPHVHTVSFISDIGYSTVFASTVSSVYMILLTVSKIIMGMAFDKLGSLKGSLLIGGCCILFPILALFAVMPAALWIYTLVLSIASSGSTILATILTANYFGRKDFSRVYSIISMFTYIGVTISSPMLGSIYDVTGSYTAAWYLIAVIGIAVCGCLVGAYITSKKQIITKRENNTI